MRISPIFAQQGALNANASSQAFLRMRSRRPEQSVNKGGCDDVYFKLAEASMRDKKIELELQSMGLI